MNDVELVHDNAVESINRRFDNKSLEKDDWKLVRD
jgi:hypothetical protein